MKVLKAGAKSIHDDSQWIPGVWRSEPRAAADGEPCGVGLHSLVCDDPLKAPVFAFPAEVWEDECVGECGRDLIKARFRCQRILHDITARFPIIVSMNEFIARIRDIPWFQPQESKSWMIVQSYEGWDAARDAAGDAARAAAGDAARAAAWAAAWAAAGDAARAAARAAAGDAAGDAAWDAAGAAARAAAGAAAGDAAWDAARANLALLVADLPVDTTWLQRWWRAWELGYWPMRENGEKLVVAKIGT